jgi:phenylacetate-coenzyme A ligase PaaK-like adenylate-forming protein
MNNFLINPPDDKTKASLIALLNKKNIHYEESQSFEEIMNLLPIKESLNNTFSLNSFNNINSQEQNSIIYFSSSGSSSEPKLIRLNFADVLNNSKIHGMGYSHTGIISNDRVATWGLSGLMNSEFTVYLGLSHTGSSIFPIGDFGSWSNLYEILIKIEPTVLLVMPSDLIPLVNYLEKNEKIFTSVRLVVFGGEPLAEVEEKRFLKVLPGIQSFRGVYQSSESGSLGYQCLHCKRGQFHLHDENYIFEILSYSDSSEGILLVTNFNRTSGEIIRYKTGDKVRKVFLNCGENNKNGIEIIGRESDLIKFGGERFDTSWFKNIASNLELPMSDFTVELVKSNLGKDLFCIYSNKLNSNYELKNKFEESFKNISIKLSQLLESDIVEQLEFHPIIEKTLNKTISGKIKTFTDLRQIKKQ